jgi:hypothetical protein
MEVWSTQISFRSWVLVDSGHGETCQVYNGWEAEEKKEVKIK